MTRTDGPIPGAESAAQPPEDGGPHVSAGDGFAAAREAWTPETHAAKWMSLNARDLGWPVVADEDLESTCEYGPHPYHPAARSDCLLFDALGPVPGEPDYDENYHDQMKDEAA